MRARYVREGLGWIRAGGDGRSDGHGGGPVQLQQGDNASRGGSRMAWGGSRQREGWSDWCRLGSVECISEDR